MREGKGRWGKVREGEGRLEKVGDGGEGGRHSKGEGYGEGVGVY